MDFKKEKRHEGYRVLCNTYNHPKSTGGSMKWDHKKIQDGFFDDINSLSRRIDELTGKARVEAYAMEIDQLLGKLILRENLINNAALLSQQTFFDWLLRNSEIEFEVHDSRAVDVARVKHAYHTEASCLWENYDGRLQ